MSAQSYLKPPRLPKTSPVVVLHLRADNDRNGNPRRCFVIMTTAGRLVEVHDEGYSGNQEVTARWPWFHHGYADDLKIEPAYMVSVDIAPAEYRRWIRAGENRNAHRDDELPALRRLRQLGDRCAGFRAVVSALGEIRRQRAVHAMRETRADDSHIAAQKNGDAATIYHRHPDDGGDAVSDFLRRALVALSNAGMVERVPFRDAATVRTDSKPFFDRSCVKYRATSTTPDPRDLTR